MPKCTPIFPQWAMDAAKEIVAFVDEAVKPKTQEGEGVIVAHIADIIARAYAEDEPSARGGRATR